MSMTSELKDKNSPFSKLIHGSAPKLGLVEGRSVEGRNAADKLGFYELLDSTLVASVPEGVENRRKHSPTVGTAFDIRTRMMLGGFDPWKSSSAKGLAAFSGFFAKYFPPTAEMVLREGFLWAANTVFGGSEEDKDCASVVLARCEAFYRAGLQTAQSSFGELLCKVKSFDGLLASISPFILEDLERLRAASVRQIGLWRNQIDKGECYVANPVFEGAPLVGGADGDWCIGNTLVECKIKEKITIPWIRDTLFQLLGYVVLDLFDCYEIRKVGIWLPRQTVFKTWSLSELIDGNHRQIMRRMRLDVQNI